MKQERSIDQLNADNLEIGQEFKKLADNFFEFLNKETNNIDEDSRVFLLEFLEKTAFLFKRKEGLFKESLGMTLDLSKYLFLYNYYLDDILEDSSEFKKKIEQEFKKDLEDLK